MNREQAAAMVARHVITRSTVPTPTLVRIALWRYLNTMRRPAEDAATEIRRVG